MSYTLPDPSLSVKSTHVSELDTLIVIDFALSCVAVLLDDARPTRYKSVVFSGALPPTCFICFAVICEGDTFPLLSTLTLVHDSSRNRDTASDPSFPGYTLEIVYTAE